MVKKSEIRSLAKRIADIFHPERIILFGSYAGGKPTESSDVDLLVVMNFEGKPARMACEIISRTEPGFPVDIMVRTPEELEKRLSWNDSFLLDITEKGKVLHEAAGTGVG